jgi:3-dehydroquinate synthase
MSASFKVRSALRSYEVEIGSGLMRGEQGSLLLLDARLSQLRPDINNDAAIHIEASESNKTLATVGQIIEAMRERGANRQSRLIAVGGGVIQDVATFAASTYMRGIEWSYYPTTLLGMVDSCIGGKSSINVGSYKNIAGNFHPPSKVMVDTDFVDSLPIVQRVAGLCEAAKICFVSKDDAFDEYLRHFAESAATQLDKQALSAIIGLSLMTKKRFIEEDEFDTGVRLLLNFGHTFGHAIEAASDFEISHGVAVGLGMLAASRFSLRVVGYHKLDARAVRLGQHVRKLLTQVDGLGEHLDRLDPSLALSKFKSDKKHLAGQYAVIVIASDGYLERRFYPIDADIDQQIINAFDCLKRVLHEVQ